MTQSSPAILIVEDDAQIRKFLRISFEAHGYTIHEARLGETGLEICASTVCDLIILDLGLPDMEGRDFIRHLREWSQIPIIVLSVRASEREKIEVLDIGANDYVTKPFGIGELMARVRVVLRSQDDTPASSAVFDLQGLYVDLLRREVRIDGVTVHLSNKEYALLRLLVSGHGLVLTHQQILQSIWGPAQRNETHYLRVLVGQLRQKLGDDPVRPRFIHTVQGVGYRLAISSR